MYKIRCKIDENATLKDLCTLVSLYKGNYSFKFNDLEINSVRYDEMTETLIKYKIIKNIEVLKDNKVIERLEKKW